MAKHLPVAYPAPAPRIIHYADPANPASGVQPLSERELAVKRRQDQVVYQRWLIRHAELAERDRKFRRFMLGLGVSVGVGLLAGLALTVWAKAALGIGLVLAIPAVVLGVCRLAVGGHPASSSGAIRRIAGHRPPAVHPGWGRG